jgi:predicted  nucleic acid-binding Zn-ribbon protein
VTELSKYESIINDLNLIETQAQVLKNKAKDVEVRNIQVERNIEQLKAENTSLNQKIAKLEGEIDRLLGKTELNIFNSLTSKEKQALKSKIDNLINKIDYHLSS